MNGYNLTRNWYNFKFENPTKTNARHSDMYFYIVDLWNRLGQKDTFGLPTSVTMEALQIGSFNTYKKILKDLIDFGFITLIQESKNQYKSKIIALSKIDKALDKAPDKALDKAHIKALDKAPDKALDSIIEQKNKEQKNKRTTKNKKIYPDWFDKNLIEIYKEFLNFRTEKKKTITKTQEPRFLNKLKEISNANSNVAEKILIQSIENGWQGIFKIKDNLNKFSQLDGKKMLEIQNDPDRNKF